MHFDDDDDDDDEDEDFVDGKSHIKACNKVIVGSALRPGTQLTLSTSGLCR